MERIAQGRKVSALTNPNQIRAQLRKNRLKILQTEVLAEKDCHKPQYQE